MYLKKQQQQKNTPQKGPQKTNPGCKYSLLTSNLISDTDHYIIWKRKNTKFKDSEHLC